MIRKVPHPEQLSQVRPISFCYRVYKIAMNMLANTFWKVFLELNKAEEPTFVGNRLIGDNFFYVSGVSEFYFLE